MGGRERERERKRRSGSFLPSFAIVAGLPADEPHRDAQEAEAHDVLAGVELVRHGVAVHLLAVLTHHVVVAALKVVAGVLLWVFQRLTESNVFVVLPAEVISVVVWVEVKITVISGVLEDAVAGVTVLVCVTL